MNPELTPRTSIWLSDEAIHAEQEVIDHLDFASARKQRFEIALIVLAQVLKAKHTGAETITIANINFKKLP